MPQQLSDYEGIPRKQIGTDQLSNNQGSRIGRFFLVLLILIVIAIALFIFVPDLRTQDFSSRFAPNFASRFSDLTDRLPLPEDEEAAASERMPTQTPDDVLLAMAGEAPATFTPTPTPHPAAEFDFTIDGDPGRARWQIAYPPDSTRDAGEGCAYLSFWLSGPDAERLASTEGIDAELVVYDGEYIFENYGRTPLSSLRGRGNSLYYEMPSGEPECRRHRLAEIEQYAGMEFRLTFLTENQEIRRFRRVLVEGIDTFATVTPTPTPAPPTPTPYPQVRIQQQTNVRAGPGTGYEVLGTVDVGEVYPVELTSPDRVWWQIDFQDQAGWVSGELADAVGVADVAEIASVPPTPPPTATLTPVPPTPTLTPVPTPWIPFLLTDRGTCEPNQAMTYFSGEVVYESGDPFNGACIHVSYEGPRNTKCTGCDGSDPGTWGFAPFGNLPGKQGTTVQIYVVPCPEDPVPMGGQNPETGFGPLNPVSPVWAITIEESIQCTGITFQDNTRPPPDEEEE